jgi:hypothetical protein
MAKPLVVQFAGVDLPLEMSRVERSDLYGYVETEALDSKGRKCFSATLADDGQTIVASGGSAFAKLSQDGKWLEKTEIKPVDAEGKAMTPVASSYAAPVPLADKATVEEYLSHNIRSVYQVSSEADLSPLMAELKTGTIFTFPYSFRGGLEADTAFLLLAADGTPFMAIGDATRLEFVNFDQAALADEEGTEGEGEELDFGMM